MSLAETFGSLARRASPTSPPTGIGGKETGGQCTVRRDQVLAVVLVLPVVAILLCLWPLVIACQGRPFLFGSVRAGKAGRPFVMWKIRTMQATPRPEVVMGAEMRQLVTPVGRWLRRTRLDELPQIINLLRGDIVLIGARPLFPRHARALPEVYDALLGEPPGLTGLATVTLCGQEDAWLAPETTKEGVDRAYRTKCLPRKRRLDLFYRSRRTPLLFAYIIVLTVCRGPSAQRGMRRLRRFVGRRLAEDRGTPNRARGC